MEMVGNNDPEIIASEGRIAKLFNFSERKVRDYFKDARVAPARYDLLFAIKIFVENSAGKDEVSEARKVETEMKKLKLGIMQGEYHYVENIKLLVTDMLARFKAKLIAIPSKASNELLNIDNRREIEDILKKMINEALKELSEYDKLKMEDIDINGAEND